MERQLIDISPGTTMRYVFEGDETSVSTGVSVFCFTTSSKKFEQEETAKRRKKKVSVKSSVI